VSKATGVPLAKVAARFVTGRNWANISLPIVRHNGVAEIAVHEFYSVKSPVFPFNKFRGVDTILGPEMRSTGEVMGISTSYGQAFAKAQLAAGQRLATQGTVFLSVNDRDKKHLGVLGKELSSLGFHLLATREPRLRWNPPALRPKRYSSERRPAEHCGPGENGQDRSGDQHAPGRESFYDEKSIRRAAIRYNIPCITTLAAVLHAAGIANSRPAEQGRKSPRCRILHRGSRPRSGVLLRSAASVVIHVCCSGSPRAGSIFVVERFAPRAC